MTRDEFNARYAANQQNTEGFSLIELAEINNKVYEMVLELEAGSDIAEQEVYRYFAMLFVEYR